MTHTLAVGSQYIFSDDYKMVHIDRIGEHYIFEIQTSDKPQYVSFVNSSIKGDTTTHSKAYLYSIKNTGTKIVIDLLDPGFKMGGFAMWLPHNGGDFTFNVSDTLPISHERKMFRRHKDLTLTKRA
jgi:hypothetical protein